LKAIITFTNGDKMIQESDVEIDVGHFIGDPTVEDIDFEF
jgi:hypothetical protein